MVLPKVPSQLLTGGGLCQHIEQLRSQTPVTHDALSLPERSASDFASLLANAADLQKVSPREFESLVAELLKADGYEDVTVVPRLNTPGPDVIAFCPTPSGDRQLFIVECKRWNRPVGISVVREMMYRIDQEFRASGGILVTSSVFTRDAVEEVRKFHRWRLHLKDGQALSEWVKRHSQHFSPERLSIPCVARKDYEDLLSILRYRDELELRPHADCCRRCGGVLLEGSYWSQGAAYDDMGLVESIFTSFGFCLSCSNYEVDIGTYFNK